MQDNTDSTDQDTLPSLIQQAVVNFKQENFGPCEDYCTRILKLAPNEFSVNQIMGFILARKGEYQRARDHLKTALEVRPHSKAVFQNLLNVTQALEDWDEAIKLINEGLKSDQNNCKLYIDRGHIEWRLGRSKEAITSFQAGLKAHQNCDQHDHSYPQIHLKMAEHYYGHKLFEGAYSHYQAAIQLYQIQEKSGKISDTDKVALLNSMALSGMAAYQLHYVQARMSENQLIYGQAKAPKNREFQRLQQAIKAKQQVQEKLNEGTNKPALLSRLVTFLEAAEDFEARDYDGALQKLSQIQDIQLEGDISHRLYADCLLAKGEYEEAANHYSTYLHYNDNDAMACFAQAKAFQGQGYFMASKDALMRAIEIDDSFHNAKFLLSQIELLQGEWNDGFIHSQARPSHLALNAVIPPEMGYKSPILERIKAPLHAKQPQQMRDKIIVLYSETPITDVIFYSRYFPLIGDHPKHTILALRPEEASLAPLYEGIRGITECYILHDHLIEADLYIPLASLPMLFGVADDDAILSPQMPKIGFSLQNEWAKKLLGSNIKAKSSTKKLRIGLSPNWQPTNGMPTLDNLITLCKNSGPHQLVCLTRPKHKQDEDELRQNKTIRYFPKAMEDPAHLAALVAQMDIVIGYESHAIHFAASMGKKSWVLCDEPHLGDASLPWWWGLYKEDTPWYATTRLYRPQTGWGWTEIIDEICEDLRFETQDS